MGHRTEILVEAFKSSGLTQKEYCVQHGIGLDTLKYHLYKNRAAVKADNSISPAMKQQPSAFMTFNPAPPPEHGGENSPIDLTIIHGRFTAFQLSAILNGMGR